MRKLWTLFKALLCLAFFFPGLAAGAAVQVPEPKGFVNDYAGALDSTDVNELNGIAAALEQATGAQMAFLIMPSIEPYDDFTYGMAVFDQWKLGQKGQNNGLLVLLALKEHRIRILTGYGLEPILPDGKLGRYRDEYLVPQLRQNRIGAGLRAIALVMAHDIAKAQGKELSGVAPRPPSRAFKPNFWPIIIIIVVIFLLGTILDARNRRRGFRRGPGSSGPFYTGGTFYRGGGGFGGGFGGFGGGFSGGGGVGGSW